MIISQYTFENESDNLEIRIVHDRDDSGANNILTSLWQNKSIVSMKVFKGWCIDYATNELISYPSNKRSNISHRRFSLGREELASHIYQMICMHAGRNHHVVLPDVPLTFILTSRATDLPWNN